MIEINVFIKNPEKITKMLGVDANKAVNQGMMFAMRRSMIRLTNHIAEHKLHGQVLNVRTNRLRSSIQKSAGNRIDVTSSGISGTVGTNVVYAKIHEYGGVIKPKTKKALKFKIGNTWVTTKQVKMPKRPYMKPSLREKTGDILRFFSEDVQKYVEKIWRVA